MTYSRDELLRLYQAVDCELRRRTSLGGYNADAETIIFMLRVGLQLIEHLIGKEPQPKPPKKAKKHARNRKTKAKGK
jgi:hypothetical protein